MNILVKSEHFQLSDELKELICKHMKVKSIDKLSMSKEIITPPKEDFRLYKKVYPEHGFNTRLSERVILTKRKYKKIEYLNVEGYVYVGWSANPEYFTCMVAKKGNLNKIILAARRQTSVKMNIVLPEDITKIINNRVIKYLKLLKKNSTLMNSGIIFHGPPGNGKTSIINYLSKKCRTIRVATNDIASERILECPTPYLYIMDDISLDLFDEKRSPKTAAYLRTVMDGNKRAVGVWILSTNEDIGIMHEAFLRPGRFDKVVELGRPTADLRRKLIESWKMAEIDTEELVSRSDGWSFAELSYVKDYMLTQKMMGESCSLDNAINSREFSPPEKNTGKIGFQA